MLVIKIKTNVFDNEIILNATHTTVMDVIAYDADIRIILMVNDMFIYKL